MRNTWPIKHERWLPDEVFETNLHHNFVHNWLSDVCLLICTKYPQGTMLLLLALPLLLVRLWLLLRPLLLLLLVLLLFVPVLRFPCSIN